MRTVILPSGGTPFISFRLMFETGSADDPPGREGLAALTAGLLAEGGTRALTYEQLLDALYPMAAGIGVQVDREATVVYGTVHRDHLDAYYDLLRQVVLEPRFDAKDFLRIRDDQRNAIVAGLRAADDEALGKEALASMLYPGQPYGRPAEGTVAGIDAIGGADPASFHRERYARDRMIVGLAGAVPDPFVRRVLDDLAALPESGAPRGTGPRPDAGDGLTALVVTKPARACAISLGHDLPVTRAADDFYPLFVAGSYFGEHRTFNGVLMTKMRSDRGLNYGDYAYVESFVQDGSSTFPLPNVPRRRQAFTIWIRPVAPENAHFAIRLAVREMRRLVRDGLPAQAFEETKEFLASYSRLWVQTPSRRLGYAMDGAFYGRLGLVEELAARLPGMTRDEVNAAVRRHLDPERLRIAIVAGPEHAGAIAEALASDAPSPIVYATDTRPDVIEEDCEVAVEPLALDRARCRIVPADAMFER
ncbi:MAG TPA: pitrilysin family protein [Candidatus Polarisedimenticolaceae bacterium]|nr:pitrilysin family protein [Candidatus Polarisedimenticolaceae bacterium]